MRLLYFLPCFILFSCCSIEKPPKPAIPDRELKEKVFYGYYYPEEENQIVKDHDLLQLAYRPYQHSIKATCYNEKTKKEPIYNKNLTVRLYDENNKMLAEDFIRIKSYDHDHNIVSVVFYLPHIETNTAEIRIVLVKDGKENIIKIIECCSTHESLVRHASRYEFFKKKYEDKYQPTIGVLYNKETECYSLTH